MAALQEKLVDGLHLPRAKCFQACVEHEKLLHAGKVRSSNCSKWAISNDAPHLSVTEIKLSFSHTSRVS